MAKSIKRRKKNNRLVRQAKRTVAALTMIMAIVIAAIPVENYGTMRASGEPETDWGYSKVLQGEKLVAENKYSSISDITVLQRVEDGKFKDVFNAKVDGTNNAMIVAPFDNNGGDYKINEQEYYGYIAFRQSYYDKYLVAYKNKNITVNYTVTNESFSSNGINYTIKKIGGVDTTNDKSVLPLEQINEVGVLYGPDTNSKANTDSLLLGIEDGDYSARVSEIQNYNQEADRIKTDTTITQGKVDALNAKCDSLATFTKNFEKIDREKVFKYIVLNYYKNGSNTLSNYTLEKVGNTYLAKAAQKGDNTDDNSYVVGGKVTIKGIASEAFLGNKKIGNIELPEDLAFIGIKAFAESGIESLTFTEGENKGGDIEIGEYAFYNCTFLSGEVEFPSNKFGKIGKGAFAVYKGNDSKALNFVFPKINNYDEKDDTKNDLQDRILAGRKTLGNVTFPAVSKEYKVPDGTFLGCINLKSVEFPDNAVNATYDPQNLFKDVTNNGLFVKGPMEGESKNSYAQPRKITWSAKNANKRAVPYKYDNNGVECWEYGVTDKAGKAPYIASVSLEKGEGGEDIAVLKSFIVNPDQEPKEKMELSIGTIGDDNDGIAIKQIGDGISSIFQGDMNDWIYKVTIEDGVEKISANAFKGTKTSTSPKTNTSALEWVSIAESVKFIGSQAFADCQKLENVEFKHNQYIYETPPGSWSDLINIEQDAFKTGSQYLTFYGAIHSGYKPFEIAMGRDNTNSNVLKSGRQICYKTGAPMNLTVMRNRHDDRATLIDYPHYKEIDDINSDYIEANHPTTPPAAKYSITTEFENNCVNTDNGMSSEYEMSIVQAALNIELPTGIESISTHDVIEKKTGGGKIDKEEVGFFDGTENQGDFDYIKYKYVWTEGNVGKTGEKDVVYVRMPIDKRDDIDEIYSKNAYVSDGDVKTQTGYGWKVNDAYVSRGGLFSGGFEEGRTVDSKDPTIKLIWTKPYEKHSYKERFQSGNDYLTSIKMPTVEKLPDYAFDSCENLLTVELGSEVAAPKSISIGALPFRGAKSIYDVDLGTDIIADKKKVGSISQDGKYVFKNMILYGYKEADEKATKATGAGYEIIELLESRGLRDDEGNDLENYRAKYEFTEIKPEEILGDTKWIAKGAFSNNENVTRIDLSSTGVTDIPEDCFRNDVRLSRVTLPETIGTIAGGAFTNVYDGIELVIPTGNCSISPDAFGQTKRVYITGVKGVDSEHPSELEKSIGFIKGVEVNFNDYRYTYHMEFVDINNDVIFTLPVEIRNGETYDLRDNPNRIPVLPDVEGYEFKYWLCTVKGNVYTPEDDEFWILTPEDRVYYPYYESTGGVLETSRTLKLAGCDAVRVSRNELFKGGSSMPVYVNEVVLLIASDKANFATWTAKAENAGEVDDSWRGFQSDPNDSKNSMIMYRMPDWNVEVKANPKPGGTSGNKPGDSTGGNTGGNTGNSGNGSGTSTTKFKVTVQYDSRDSDVYEYDYVKDGSVKINAPYLPNKDFVRWEPVEPSTLSIDNKTSTPLVLKMQEGSVTVKAIYKSRTSSTDDEDDSSSSSSSRRPGTGSTSSTTTTVPNRENGTTAADGTTGTVNNTAGTGQTGNTGNAVNPGNSEGNRIYITKNGVSNTDVASLAVNGSTDNFIVRISESAEATAAVEQALRNEYGSLEGLSYLPMDISLYDSTGQNKITDTTGLNITVTMPIPDVLIQYGGNARVAAADNGALTQLTPRFTTIDGIGCISFVPPHFSPYVIYVDTNNLVAGQMLDATPATGDPIHPKWFAALGMACISILLFVTSDGRRRKNYKAA